uniref:peptidylprolyl isomerase n=1 Tax=Coccolithus braarudii TaxID=221442 RepID=A0A7S0Q847_9EUKA|mmetsp:Transcript_4741/g.10349  ORF Transcript_4741/g.10349 Transcript_4741/m.10349 type:complete len:197 (+) Transcript_4741:2-592(+)
MPLAPPAVEKLLKGTTTKRTERPGAALPSAKKQALVTAAPAVAKAAPPVSAKAKPTQPTKAVVPAATAVAPAAVAKAVPPVTKVAPKPAVRTLQGGLQVQDARDGKGAAVTRGKRVNVKYMGTLTNGKKFDAGSIQFRLGGGEVIKGWDVGVAGMKVGGKRLLTIPPELAYGRRGAPPSIPPNATLKFEVELLNYR